MVANQELEMKEYLLSVAGESPETVLQGKQDLVNKFNAGKLY